MVKFKVNGEEFTIREYKEGDEKQLLLLMKEVFGKNQSLTYWNWEYKKNPRGFSILLLLNKEGKIIGQYAHLLKKTYFYGKEYTFFMAVDICIKNEYRGFGLLDRLVNQLPQFHSKKPFLNYGFPSDHILNAYQKVPKYRNSGECAVKLFGLSKKYATLSRLLYFFNKKTKKNSLEIFEVSENNKQDIDRLWNKKKKELKISIIRDWRYLNWRILTCPDNIKLFLIRDNGKIAGYFSVMIKDKICYIVDILLLNKFVTNKNIYKIEEFCRSYYNKKEIRIFITDKLIQNKLLDSRFSLVEFGNFIYYTNIKRNIKILPYLTFIDYDSI